MGTIIGDYIGTTIRDPFPHSLSTRQTSAHCDGSQTPSSQARSPFLEAKFLACEARGKQALEGDERGGLL